MNHRLARLGIFAILLLSVAASPKTLAGEAVSVPGDANRLCYYSNFFYNFPTDDFLYYLNERMLFSEPPDGTLAKDRLRIILLGVAYKHKDLKSYVSTLEPDENGRIVLDLDNPDQFQTAVQLLEHMGRRLKKSSKGTYSLASLPVMKDADYFRFSLLRANTLTQQMNRTNSLVYRLREKNIHFPWSMEFIREVTGLDVNTSSFFEEMVKNEHLSLLTAILYRLSDLEIDWISNLDPSARFAVWKMIYSDKKWLMGMYVLSHALRVKKGENRLILPGGDAAADFWSKMCGTGVKPDTADFLKQLAVKDDGKLNFLYVFSYFLPEDIRKALLLDYNAAAFTEIYDLILLGEHEKINPSAFPALGAWNFYTLLYTLKAKEGKINIPLGPGAWLKAIQAERAEEAAGEEKNTVSLSGLFKELLTDPGSEDEVGKLQTFIALYTKFHRRPEILADGVLAQLFSMYRKYNGLVDFIEKLPIKKAATVLKLAGWIQSLENIGDSNKRLFSEIYQSLFEILSFTARYAPDRFDYDSLVSQLIDIPLDRAKFYPQLIKLLKSSLGLRKGSKSLVDVMLTGIRNQTVKLSGANYLYTPKSMFKQTVKDIMTSQEGWKMDIFLELRSLFEQVLKLKPRAAGSAADRIKTIFRPLPHPAIGRKAPKVIRNRVSPYSPSKLTKQVEKLAAAVHTGTEQKEIKRLSEEIESDCLIYQFRDHLMILAYAANAGSNKLRIFRNPNLVRLHDIAAYKGRTLWDNFGETKKDDVFSDYHLTGNFSRLNILLAPKWETHLFRGNVIHNFPHVQAVLVNLMGLYPAARVDEAMTLYALQVELGLDILRSAPEDEALADETRRMLAAFTSGYHYRKAISYIDGKTQDHNLFFSEIRKLGELYAEQGKGLDRFPDGKALKRFKEPPLDKKIETQLHYFGSSHYHVFGNLEPQQMGLFPQELTNLLQSGWLSGAMVDEFKVKLSHYLYKKHTPAPLLGQMLFMYFTESAKKFLRQNHIHDYTISYFIFDIFNNSHLQKQIKTLQKKGYLRLK
jgi:hypothetical protein